MSAALEGYTYLKVAGKGEGLEGARRTLSARFSRGPRTSKSEAGQIAVPKFGDIRWPSTRRNSAVLASCSYAFPDEGVFLDLLSAEKRSWLMSRIKSKDTTPELAVRRLLHRLGYRYRLHTAHLPGKPDLVFPARKKVVFVHGCFWHGHAGCRYAKTPGSRSEFWREKMDRNRSRDQRNQKELEDLGWSVFVVWQCQLRQPANVLEELKSFLGPPGPQPRRRRSSRDSPTLR
ncbi:hypothetical protein R82526_04045 [Ralstonia mannitolilytica]|uniref:very short patch repair endonuclease n=1 Tax=Ralstonia mannitolilytica TaxID=105219 RepID=UPI0028F6918E|nr:very short patch repair endonuclease [Ralstonia mannitolilytica]CAJ0693770.1 hypothetical protein R82526_04045 [Ralstonia mannitolilytica]